MNLHLNLGYREDGNTSNRDKEDKNKCGEEAKSTLDGLSLHIFRVGKQGRIHLLPSPWADDTTPLAELGATHVQTHLLPFGTPCSQAIISF